jgi:hypothetical protein
MKIEFESEYTHGDLVNLKVEKSVVYIITGYALHGNHVTYEISNADGSQLRHGVEIEKYQSNSVKGLRK